MAASPLEPVAMVDAGVAAQTTRGHKKRARTRRQLLDAALRVFARKGPGAASIQEITAEANVANGTFYNYFRTKDEVVAAAADRLAEYLADEISVSYAALVDPAERVAVACRRFVLRAIEDSTWGWAMIRITGRGPVRYQAVIDYCLRDLRAGKRRKRFQIRNELAAVDLVFGSVMSAMRSVLEGRATAAHASAVAALVLRGLGVPPGEAEEVAARPLPATPPGPEPTPALAPKRRS